jgi:hypothetical protein
MKLAIVILKFTTECNIQTVMCPVATLTSSIPEGTNITAVCSGNGRCASLREVTGYQTFNTRLDYTQYAGWDADKIRGCLCEPGWGGIACEKRLCPKGDDPVLAGELGSNTAEVQLIDCLCTDCKGIDMSAFLIQSLSLTLRGIASVRRSVHIVCGAADATNPVRRLGGADPLPTTCTSRGLCVTLMHLAQSCAYQH